MNPKQGFVIQQSIDHHGHAFLFLVERIDPWTTLIKARISIPKSSYLKANKYGLYVPSLWKIPKQDSATQQPIDLRGHAFLFQVGMIGPWTALINKI